MRKSLKVFSGVMVVVAIALTYSWPYVKMEFAGSAHYTEQDKREYDFYTPDILKKCRVFLPTTPLILQTSQGLIERGFSADVDLCLAVDADPHACRLQDDRFICV